MQNIGVASIKCISGTWRDKRMRTDNPPDRVIRIIADMIRGGRLLPCLDVQRRTLQRSFSRHCNNHHVAHRLQRRILCSSRIMNNPRPIILGSYSPSQNGIIVSPHGIALCIAGGGKGHDVDKPKILIEYD